jgi:regulator of nucleoside diphosphate kinase
MEGRIVLSKQDLLRLRPLLNARTRARASDREHMLDLEQEIERAAIVEEGALSDDVVAVGSTVTLFDLESAAHAHYTLVLPSAANASEGRISVLAPLGTALLGYSVGDIVEWRMPGGVRRLCIEAVRHTDRGGCELPTQRVAA